MTQHEEGTFVPHSAVAVTDPSYWDVWHNPTDQTFLVAVHVDHNMLRGGKAKGVDPITRRLRPEDEPRKEFFKLLPHSDTPIPKMYRSAIQTYQCDHPDCRSRPGSKICDKDHPAIVVGGQCPQAIRKGAPHIRPNAVFSSEFEETVLETRGVSGERRSKDNREKLQPKLEKLWKEITEKPAEVVFGPMGPGRAPAK